jgi:hypothetical protein
VTNPRNATTTARGRTYKWRDETFDSVTTIIGGGIPKPALKAWGERTVAEFAVDRRDEWDRMDRSEAVDWLKRAPFRATDKAAAQGTDVHAWAEAHVLGQPVPDPPAHLVPYCNAFRAFLDEWQPEFVMTEATVYSRTHGYAGTCDFIARLPGLGVVLGDYKTGKGVYPEVALQLAAYRHAEFVGLPDGTEEPLPTIDSCAVLHITPKGYEVIPVDAGPVAFDLFLTAAVVRDFCGPLGATLLGAALPVPEAVAS